MLIRDVVPRAHRDSVTVDRSVVGIKMNSSTMNPGIGKLPKEKVLGTSQSPSRSLLLRNSLSRNNRYSLLVPGGHA